MRNIFSKKNLVFGGLLLTAITAAVVLPLAAFAYGAAPPADSSDNSVTQFTKTGTNFRVSGSTTLYALISRDLGTVSPSGQETSASGGPFQLANPSYSTLNADISNLGSSHAAEDLAPGYTDVGVMSRTFKSSDAAGLTGTAIARDGIVAIIHISSTDANPVTDISKAQLLQIYNAYNADGTVNSAGSITNWSAINSSFSEPVTIAAREGSSGTYSAFKDLIGLDANREAETFVKMGLPNRSPSAQDVINQVAATPGCIGYVSIGNVSVAMPPTVRILTVGGKYPTPQNVTTNVYPLSRYLWIVQNTTSPNISAYGQGAAEALKNFMLGLTGQNNAETEGFVRLAPRADVNSDKVVDILDVTKVGLKWGSRVSSGAIQAGDTADVNQDGVVDILDVTKIGLWWGIHYTMPTVQQSTGATYTAPIYPN